MGNSHDPSRYRDKFEDELQRLEKLPYQQDARAIRTWANQMTGEYSTRTGRICYVRTLSRRAAAGDYPPLTEMESVDDFYELHDSIRNGTNPDVKDEGLAESTLRTMRQAARLFFKDGRDVEWATQIQVGGPQETKVTADDIFVSDEVEALFSACRNPRDKAVMATLLATGLRLTALLSIQRGDVTFDGPTGFINVSDDAIGLKGFAGKRPLLFATEYVKNWLDVHPVEDDDAALFCRVKDQPDTKNDTSEPGDPLPPWGIQQQLRRVKRRAAEAGEFPEDKAVNPHNFRHSAVSRMVLDGLSDQRIKWLVGWHPDSGQLARYTHVKDDQMLAGVLDHYDIEAGPSDLGKPSLDTCPSCGAVLNDWVNPVACPGCGVALSHSAAEVEQATDEIQDDATDAAVDSTDSDEIRALKAIRDAVDDPQALAQKLAELEDGSR